MRRRLGLFALLAALVSCGPPARKLIEFGWDIPNPETLRRDVEAMEAASPFDGVVLDVPLPSGGNLGWSVWGPRRLDPGDLERARADLRATRFRRFTDNFARFNSAPGTVDWFDEDWSAVAHNAGVVARFARESGLKGLVVDLEHYDPAHAVFDYRKRPQQTRRSFQEYAEKARQRGRELARAVDEQFPDAVLLHLFGHSLVTLQWKLSKLDPTRPRDEKLAQVPYGLLAPFLDGVFEGAGPRLQLHDVFELSYGYKTRAQFEAGRSDMLASVAASRVPERVQRRLQVGFGLWLDNESTFRGWHPEEPRRNHFTPAEFEAALREAMVRSDRYVWVYSERLNWWTGRGLTPAYREAVERAKAAATAEVAARR